MAEILRVIKGAYVSWKYMVIENHPADSRVKIKDDGICQSLTSRMGTGGGNVPLILQIDERTDSFRINTESCNDYE